MAGGSGSPAVVHNGLCCQPVSDAALVDTFGAPRPGGRRHEGIDIFADEGTPIHAIAGGTVVGGSQSSLGGVVTRIQGDDGRYYYYAHLVEGSNASLRPGDRVELGDVIGQVGRTGNAATTPPHLHLQIRENGQWINPFDFLEDLPDFEDLPAGAGGAPAGSPFDIDRGAPPSVADADGDGLTDEFERLLGTDLTLRDTDRDGLSDAFETGQAHTDPLLDDTDRDRVPDAVEIAAGTNAGRGTISEAARQAGFGGLASVDTDKDGLDDLFEAKLGTDPTARDSDKDGLADALEAAYGSNPLLLDSDRDGLTDKFEAEIETLEPVDTPDLP